MCMFNDMSGWSLFIKIDTTYWIDVTFDATEASYPIYGEEGNDLLIGRLWCEGAQGYIALYFAKYNAIKFRIRRHGPYMKIKFWHEPREDKYYKKPSTRPYWI